MTTTRLSTQISSPKAWAKAIASPACEFPLTPLPVLEGQIPLGLRGSLYRNGPGRLERGGMRMGHWFDGDGAILAVHFTESGAAALYRYVQTSGYLAESEAGKLLYGNYGMTAPGPIWNQWMRSLKNTANTSVVALPDRLLALWEGGKPYAIDLQTLATLGTDDLGGLEDDWSYSAHPKQDVTTGELFNFGVSPGRNAVLHLYRSSPTGAIRQKAAIELEGVPLVHDFALAGPYLVFCIPPVRLNLLPVLSGLSSFSDALAWKPELGTEILVVDRETLKVVSQSQTDPWYQWHFGHAELDADGSVAIDLVRYPDFQTNQYLKEVANGQTQTMAKGTLWQLRLDPQSGRVQSMQEWCDRGCEFPIAHPTQAGTDRFTYLSVHTSQAAIGEEMFGTIARFDHATATLVTANLGTNRYPMEPLYASDAINPQQGWVLTVVFDGNTDTSEVWIFDSDRLADAPVCRLGLPKKIPLGFHGTWNPNSPSCSEIVESF
jgi:carotenoid cleavage dioxygenase-like enzyme